MITTLTEFKYFNEKKGFLLADNGLVSNLTKEEYDVEQFSKLVENLMNEIESRYSSVDLFIYYSKLSHTIILSKIIIDKKDRSKGIGTKVINEICDFADKQNLRIALTPSSDFGGSKSRLIQFYKSFGFKNYKGYEFRERMIRLPN